MSHLYTRSFGFVLAILILACAAFLPNTTQAAPVPLFGWIWSSPWVTGSVASGTSTIGWISVNSANPGATGGAHSVLVNDDGTLTGYAWSSNVGWIKFGGLSGFPAGGSTQGNAHVSGASIVGWARACSGTVKSTDPYLAQLDYPLHVPTQIGDCSTMTSRPDGWDGWIELTGTSHVLAYDSATKAITGYGWGAMNIGWMTFNLLGTNTTIGSASCTLSSTTIKANEAYKLSWNSVGMSYCTGVNFPGAGTSGNYEVRPKEGSTVYSMSCVPTSGNPTPVLCASAVNITITGGGSGAIGVGVTPIQMWLNNDVAEAQAAIRVRPATAVKVNWKKNDAATFIGCSGMVGGNFLGEDEGFDTNEHPYDSPYTIPSDLLVPGTQYFSMTCNKSGGGTVTGKTKDGTKTQLQIKVVDPNIEEI